jgi:hypothetical protein
VGRGSSFFVRLPSEQAGTTPDEVRNWPIYGQGSQSR